jgi:hypothetical protein
MAGATLVLGFLMRILFVYVPFPLFPFLFQLTPPPTDADSQPILTILHAHDFPVTSLRFNPSGTVLISGSADNSIRVIAVPRGTLSLPPYLPF